MSVRNYYSAPVTGSAPMAIPATIPAHRVLIEEDGLTQQGLVVTFSQDGFVQPYTYAVGATVELVGHGHNGIVGRPANFAGANNPAAADTYAKVTSATSTGTHVRVIEIEQ